MIDELETRTESEFQLRPLIDMKAYLKHSELNEILDNKLND